MRLRALNPKPMMFAAISPTNLLAGASSRLLLCRFDNAYGKCGTWRGSNGLPAGSALLHSRAAEQDNRRGCLMPSLIRFLMIIGVIGGVFYGTFYVLSEYFEPEPKEMTKPLRGVKVRN